VATGGFSVDGVYRNATSRSALCRIRTDVDARASLTDAHAHNRPAEGLRCLSLVSVMEPTDLWDRHDRPGACCRDRSRIWRVFLEAKVRPTPVIVPAVEREHAARCASLRTIT
jgi:hypothetical protein